MDGDAMTKELEAAYATDSSQDLSDEVLLVREPGLLTTIQTRAQSNVPVSTRAPSSTNNPPAVSTSSLMSSTKSSPSSYSPLSSTPTVTSSSTPSTPALITEEPWHSMTNCLTRIANGELNIEFPSEQPMSVYHTLLFRLARKSMSNYLKGKKEQKGKTKDGLVRKDMANDGLIDQESDGKKGANSVDLKDAMVALSCTFNTMSASSCDYIQEHSKGVVYEASALCEIKDFDKHACLKILREYSTSLQSNEAVETLRKRVLRDRADLLDITPSPKVVHQGKTLRILEHLCEFVLHKPYGTQKPSEHDCLKVWTTIFRERVQKRRVW